MNRDGLTCRELVELVTDYVEGAFSPPDRERFEAHLAICEGCATYLEQIRETVRLIGAVTEDHLTPDAREALLRTFRDWRSPA